MQYVNRYVICICHMECTTSFKLIRKTQKLQNTITTNQNNFKNIVTAFIELSAKIRVMKM